MKKIGVITPSMPERFAELRRAVESVKCQGVPVRHVVVVDGRPQVKEAGVEYYEVPRQPNTFGSPSRNLGLDRIEPDPDIDYVLFLDDDCFFLPGAFGRLRRFLAANGNPVCCAMEVAYFGKERQWRVLPEMLPPTCGYWDTHCGVFRADAIRGLRWNNDYIADYWFAAQFAERNGNPPWPKMEGLAAVNL